MMTRLLTVAQTHAERILGFGNVERGTLERETRNAERGTQNRESRIEALITLVPAWIR